MTIVKSLQNTLSRGYRRIEKLPRRLNQVLEFIATEAGNDLPVPILRRFNLWRRGFNSESHFLYDFDRFGFDKFLPDYTREFEINGRNNLLLRDKLVFHTLLSIFSEYLPHCYGLIKQGRLKAGLECDSEDASDFILAVLEKETKLVLKRRVGASGVGFKVVCLQNGTLTVNDRQVTKDEFRDMIKVVEPSILYEFVEQHQCLSRIYSRTTNTLRMMTMWDETKDEPFIAVAVLRIGSEASYPVDTWSKGGLCSAVDIETGRIGRAVAHPKISRRKIFSSVHPDTGEQIEGETLPHWDLIKQEMCRICRHIPFLRYIGWDITPTETSFKILEGNDTPGLHLVQVHYPILSDPRIHDFYRAHGVI